MSVLTCDEVERKALEEYRALVGQKILCYMLICSDGDVALDVPIVAIIEPTQENDIARWNDHEWLDPIYDIKVVDWRGNGAIDVSRAYWVYGTSLSINGESEGHERDWELLSKLESDLLKTRNGLAADGDDECVLGL